MIENKENVTRRPLVPEDVERVHLDGVAFGVDAVHQDLASAPCVVEGLLSECGNATGLDDDVEAVRVILLEFFATAWPRQPCCYGRAQCTHLQPCVPSPSPSSGPCWTRW